MYIQNYFTSAAHIETIQHVRLKSLHLAAHNIGRRQVFSLLNNMSTILQNHNTFDDRQQMVQNSILIWLDPNINKSNDDVHHSKTQLQCIINTIEIFIDFDHVITSSTCVTSI